MAQGLQLTVAFAFVGLKGLAGAYKPRTFLLTLPGSYRVPPPARPRSGQKPKPMTEAEKQKAKAELQTYQTSQKWIERGRAVRDLFLSFIVTFVFGHGVFYLVVWIIQGFR